MIKYIIQYSLSFLLLISLQVLLLNNMHLNIYLNPYLYVLFILILPLETPNWMLLLLGFLTGLVVDIFSSSAGIHASACVFLAFIRTYLLKFISPRDGYEFGQKPRAQNMGWYWFITYASIAVLFHHLFLFYIEAFTFTNFFLTLMKVILSSIFTLILILVNELLVHNR